MQLLTKKIITALPKIYATDGVPLDEKIIICKFFTPDANWTWFVFEGEPNGNTFNNQEVDYKFFGMVHGLERAMGYFLGLCGRTYIFGRFFYRAVKNLVILQFCVGKLVLK